MKIWGRIGAYFEVSQEEIDILCGEDSAIANALLLGKIKSGEFQAAGETYFPCESYLGEGQQSLISNLGDSYDCLSFHL